MSEMLPETIPHDAPLTTIERGEGQISEGELEELRQALEQAEQEREVKGSRYMAKIRAQEGSVEEYDRELQQMSLKVRERQQELNLIEY